MGLTSSSTGECAPPSTAGRAMDRSTAGSTSGTVPMDDREAIRQLKARYFRAMDTKDWSGLRRVFADDVVMDTTASGGSVITGAEPFLAFLREAIGDVITVHHGHTPEIELTSPTTAT